MSAITTRKFKTHNAKQLVESFSEAANTAYYLLIGRPTVWTNSTSGAADTEPPTPVDTVSNTTFNYWRDAIALKKVNPTDVVHVIPRNDWTTDMIYQMYDQRDATLFSNTTNPFFVITSNNDVYKCLYNSKNSSSVGVNSTAAPSGTGNTAISVQSGAYVWKYMFTVSAADALKFLNDSYVPVRTLTSDDGSSQWDVQIYANTVNGAIEVIRVDSPGSGYSTSPTVTITGDGTGASATATVTANAISAITVVASGNNYSKATVTITDASGTGAQAWALIPPRNGVTAHGRDAIEELGASRVMLYSEFADSISNTVTTVNNYRRLALIKDPLDANGAVATANVYRQTLDIVLTGASGTFTKDEVVRGSTSNSHAVVVDWDAPGNTDTLRLVLVEPGLYANSLQRPSSNAFVVGETITGIGNGNTTPSLPEAFTPAIIASGATGVISTISEPQIQPFSGDLLYTEQRSPVERANTQTEIVRIVVSY